MSNKKEATYIKANGLRNELKEIRKSIDALTNALMTMQQTNKRYEKNYANPPGGTDSSDDWGMYDYE